MSFKCCYIYVGLVLRGGVSDNPVVESAAVVLLLLVLGQQQQQMRAWLTEAPLFLLIGTEHIDQLRVAL